MSEQLLTPMKPTVTTMKSKYAPPTQKRALESWLHQQVGTAFDAIQADPSRGMSADQVRAHLTNSRNKVQDKA
jgi:hypothetical protein